MAVSNLSVISVFASGNGALANLYFESDTGINSALNPGIEISDTPDFSNFITTTFGVTNPGSVSLFNMPNGLFGGDIGLIDDGQGSPVFALNTTYYWRIRYDIVNDAYAYENGPPIDTSNVGTGLPWGPNDVAEYPFNYTATYPEQSLGPYSVLFGWLGIAGENWTLEYTEVEDFSIVASYDVSGLDYFPSPAEFQPDILYYWRIRLPSADYDGIPFTVPFGAPPEVILDEYPYAPQEPNETPVNEPDDLINLPQANLGNKLHSAADSIRAARQRIRDWADS